MFAVRSNVVDMFLKTKFGMEGVVFSVSKVTRTNLTRSGIGTSIIMEFSVSSRIRGKI